MPVIWDVQDPVLVGLDPQVTEYAWRRNTSQILNLPGGVEAAKLTDYTRFARIEKVDDLVNGRRSHLVEELAAFASEPLNGPLRRMQQNLGDFADRAVMYALPYEFPSNTHQQAKWHPDAFTILAMHLRSLRTRRLNETKAG